MRFRLIALAAIAVAGHQNLMAGYRVVGEPVVDAPFASVPEPLPSGAVTAPVSMPLIAPAPVDSRWQAERIRMLEAENQQLRMRLREAGAEPQPQPKRRALSQEDAEATSIGFELGSVALTQSTSRKVEIVTRARAASSVEIVGYTDNTGDAQINKRIALARAQLVKDMLVRNGIPASAIKVREQSGVYYATNDTVEGRAANRRAIVTFN